VNVQELAVQIDVFPPSTDDSDTRIPIEKPGLFCHSFTDINVARVLERNIVESSLNNLLQTGISSEGTSAIISHPNQMCRMYETMPRNFDGWRATVIHDEKFEIGRF
jgi:hypothetical protein